MERGASGEDFASWFYGEVRKALETTPEGRWGRVLELRRQVEEGSYRPPVDELARKLLEAGLMEVLDATYH